MEHPSQHPVGAGWELAVCDVAPVWPSEIVAGLFSCLCFRFWSPLAGSGRCSRGTRCITVVLPREIGTFDARVSKTYEKTDLVEDVEHLTSHCRARIALDRSIVVSHTDRLSSHSPTLRTDEKTSDIDRPKESLRKIEPAGQFSKIYLAMSDAVVAGGNENSAVLPLTRINLRLICKREETCTRLNRCLCNYWLTVSGVGDFVPIDGHVVECNIDFDDKQIVTLMLLSHVMIRLNRYDKTVYALSLLSERISIGSYSTRKRFLSSIQ